MEMPQDGIGLDQRLVRLDGDGRPRLGVSDQIGGGTERYESAELRRKDGEIHHRPDRDVTMSASQSVSLMAMIGGDPRIVTAHDRAVKTTLGWIEKNAVLTRMQGGTVAMVHAGDQRMVVDTFQYNSSQNLDPQLHTHCVIDNMVEGNDGKWRTIVNDRLYHQQKAISAIYRAELADGLARGDQKNGLPKIMCSLLQLCSNC